MKTERYRMLTKGDVVVLKSGSPLCTVVSNVETRNGNSGGYVNIVFFDKNDNRFVYDCFPVEALTPTKDEK